MLKNVFINLFERLPAKDLFKKYTKNSLSLSLDTWYMMGLERYTTVLAAITVDSSQRKHALQKDMECAGNIVLIAFSLVVLKLSVHIISVIHRLRTHCLRSTKETG